MRAEPLEPFYFGDPPRFGCLHPVGEATRGVLIAPPIGHEYIGFHRASRQLADTLARRGRPVLRFDWRGTGDSEGDLSAASVDGWQRDVADAAAELRRRNIVLETVVGLRLGATIAALAASALPEPDRIRPPRLVLWDPVVKGTAYLSHLKQQARRMWETSHVIADPNDTSCSGLEVLGECIPNPLATQFEELDLLRLEFSPAEEILLVRTAPEEETSPLADHLGSLDGRHEDRHRPSPELWAWNEDLSRVQLPHGVLKEIEEWVAREPAP